MPLKESSYTFQQFTPGDFENFRKSAQADGFILSQNTVDTVAGHIGALVYLTGSYNRNQNILTVILKTSPWLSFQESDIKANVLRVTSREGTSDDANLNPVNTTPVKTQTTGSANLPLRPVGAVVTPPVTTLPASVAELPKTEPTKPPVEEPKPATSPVQTQTPKPAQTPIPANKPVDTSSTTTTTTSVNTAKEVELKTETPKAGEPAEAEQKSSGQS